MAWVIELICEMCVRQWHFPLGSLEAKLTTWDIFWAQILGHWSMLLPKAPGVQI